MFCDLLKRSRLHHPRSSLSQQYGFVDLKTFCKMNHSLLVERSASLSLSLSLSLLETKDNSGADRAENEPSVANFIQLYPILKKTFGRQLLRQVVLSTGTGMAIRPQNLTSSRGRSSRARAWGTTARLASQPSLAGRVFTWSVVFQIEFQKLIMKHYYEVWFFSRILRNFSKFSIILTKTRGILWNSDGGVWNFHEM